ncbi:C13 family peptidase [Polaromonas sp. A23]|uniref:C13 family peptidase n=1 Tax=Polaromonas sp. A23 TaxID=1944133 RepID=UPI0009874FBB|nr:C13 family peptidase [Polaromonas sp. A23]OOG41087.1 hypothetical protein B0B52_12145 [Polaromonas sp. A23]
MHDSQVQHTLPGIPEPLLNPADRGRPDPAGWLSTSRWIAEGLRAAFFLPVRVAGKTPTPLQVLAIAVLVAATEVALMRLEVAGPAVFNLQAWLSTWWTTGLGIGLAWWTFPALIVVSTPEAGESIPDDQPPRGVAAFFTLWLAAALPNVLVAQGVVAAIAHGWIKATVFSAPWVYWAFYLVVTVWALGVSLFLIVRFAGWTWRTAVFALVLLATTGLTAWQFEARTWEKDYASQAGAEDSRPRLSLSQETMEGQQALWQRTVAGIAPQRPGVTDVYGLVFAPYAAEDVFLRESTLVNQVLTDRFDAAGRVVHLLNHAGTVQTHPWATPLNLQRAIEALARHMDKDNDVLVVYLTSHGARDFKLAASHWPLDVAPLSPVELREALDKAGIRNRVIAVSACYSGGWIDALAGDDTLVMTAADATHTSYGCGQLSELTFFGRAMFDEQLKSTHSFEQAFASAVPVIKQREIDAGKADGFSNPQIRVGANIGPVLRELEQRLGR